jgi:long-chain acyl-CoA synthetase
LGGNVKLLVCGSAAISAEVLNFLKIALGCEIVEGELFVIFLGCI